MLSSGKSFPISVSHGGRVMSESNPVRVLVVDDYPPVADQVADFFDSPGTVVHVAYSAFEALQLVDFEPQMIFIDDHLGPPGVYNLAQSFRDDPACERSIIINLVDWDHPGLPPLERPCPVDYCVVKDLFIELPAIIAEFTRQVETLSVEQIELVAQYLQPTDLQEEVQRLASRLGRPGKRNDSNQTSKDSDENVKDQLDKAERLIREFHLYQRRRSGADPGPV
jgi:CheY-like chemotaxis protein